MRGSETSITTGSSGTTAPTGSYFEPEAWRKDRRRYHHKVVGLIIVLVLVCLASLLISVTTNEVYSPSEAFDAIRTWFYVAFMQIFQGQTYTTVDIQHMCPCYYQVIDRVGITFIALLCGMILTISGMVYQSVFRNPVAGPTMLGVGSGLNLGLLIFVWIYGTAALYASLPHYVFAYGGAIAVLIIVLVLSRIINGHNWFSSVDMLLVGSIFSQAIGAIVLYVSYYVFDETQWLTYTTINEVLTVNTDAVAYIFLIVAFLVSFIPLFLVRFRLNALSFTEEEARGFGVNLNRTRYVALFLATIMIIAAMAHSGMIGMAALIVPFISRAFFGAETRKQIVGNILIGGILIVVCRDCADLLSILLWHMGFVFNFPIGIVATLICLPVFVWILARQQRTWE